MMGSALAQHTKWRDTLVYHLRMDDIPGDRIGDILLEVESHLAETGETPQEAFGDPKAYAASRVTAADQRPDSDANIWILIGLSFFGSMLYVAGALGAGRGSAVVFGVNPWLLIVVGAVLLVLTALRLPDDLVRHPATGQPLIGGKTIPRAAVIGFFGGGGIVFFLIGRLLA